MPTYNSSKYISETLKSIKEQICKDYELIVCDKMSTDDTIRKIIDAKINNYRVKTVEENGVPAALNIGFRNCQGEILCWMNSDDVFINQDALADVVNLFNREPNCDIVIGDFLVINESGWVVDYKMYNIMDDYRQTNIFTGALFFRKNVWKKFGKFSNENKYAFEYELINFIYENYRQKIWGLNIAISALRIHDETLTNLNFAQMHKEAIKIQSRTLKSEKPASKLKRIRYIKVMRLVEYLFKKVLYKLIRKNWADGFSKP